MTGLKPTVKALCMLNILTQWAVPSIIAPRFEVLLVMKMSVVTVWFVVLWVVAIVSDECQ
jgi:hypothetical protein